MCKTKLLHGDNLKRLRPLADDSVDSCVTDPPYGLKFMSKKWDHDVPSVELWREVYRVLKPGAHLLSFFGTRTYHRGVVAIEDAGFEIRDQVGWLYGTGFPKSHNIGKAIDKAAGQWDGWGTALKPAWEPIVVARKPLIGTVAQNVLEHGTGGLNIDGCRVNTADNLNGGRYSGHGPGEADGSTYGTGINERTPGGYQQSHGRWPANIIHDGSDEVLAEFAKYGETSGTAARFFYNAKASKKERGEGNKHPTVKPLALMEYLIKLVTPPGGTVLDPFAGSGSTLIAAKTLGFNSIGCELEQEYIEIIRARMRERFS